MISSVLVEIVLHLGIKVKTVSKSFKVNKIAFNLEGKKETFIYLLNTTLTKKKNNFNRRAHNAGVQTPTALIFRKRHIIRPTPYMT